ncbi:hypothetical protein F2P79_021377 [Pimephales promelas]|nr:hypothetical protein F2P79_021377 [Pimephales promelas]
MFHFILFVGFLCFSVGESTTTDAPTTIELTTETTESTTMTSAPSTQQPDPSIITGLRIAVKSLIDLASSNPSPEMELIVRQIEGFIPSQHRATTSITVRKIQRRY